MEIKRKDFEMKGIWWKDEKFTSWCSRWLGTPPLLGLVQEPPGFLEAPECPEIFCFNLCLFDYSACLSVLLCLFCFGLDWLYWTLNHFHHQGSLGHQGVIKLSVLLYLLVLVWFDYIGHICINYLHHWSTRSP